MLIPTGITGHARPGVDFLMLQLVLHVLSDVSGVVIVASTSNTSSSQLLPTLACNSWQQQTCLSNLAKSNDVGLSHEPHFSLMTENKFSNGSWLSRRVNRNLKSHCSKIVHRWRRDEIDIFHPSKNTLLDLSRLFQCYLSCEWYPTSLSNHEGM